MGKLTGRPVAASTIEDTDLIHLVQDVGGTPTSKKIAYSALEEKLLPHKLNLLHVGKHGNDSNDGLTNEEAFLTFGAAITYAATQTPSSINRFSISCYDAGDYTEDIDVPEWCGVFATNAKITGNHTVMDNSLLQSFRLIAATGTAVSKTIGTGAATVVCPRLILTDAADGISAETGVINYSGSSAEVVNGHCFSNSTTGVMNVSITFIYITGTGQGVRQTSTGVIMMKCGSITDTGSGTALTILGSGTTFVDATSIDCSVAYNVGVNGIIALSCASLIGTKTCAGTCTYMSSDNGSRFGGYSAFGSDAPMIKMKEYSGTTASTEGGSWYVAHGLTAANILSVEIVIEYSPGGYMPTGYTHAAGFIINKQWDTTNIEIVNHPTDSENTLSKPFKLLVTYKE